MVAVALLRGLKQLLLKRERARHGTNPSKPRYCANHCTKPVTRKFRRGNSDECGVSWFTAECSLLNGHMCRNGFNVLTLAAHTAACKRP